MEDDIYDEIDALARAIERQIVQQQEFINGLSEFDSKYRKMEEAELPSPEELFG